MELRPELEPNIKKAEELFPKVIALISQFDDGFDHGDMNKMDFALKELSTLIKKEIEKEDLYEYWSYTSIEDLAFKLSLPSPKKVDNISEQEVLEINERIESLEEADETLDKSISKYLFDKGVVLSYILVDEYYNPLLEINDPSPPSNVIHL